jgi:prepilin-type N-terminal cleavage/methylation domain-containing protein
MWTPVNRKDQFGFSLLEMMVAMVALLIVCGIVMSAMTQMLNSQSQIANRTEMHAGVRSATELLQQEIGQAGKVSLGAPAAAVTLHAAVAIGTSVSFSLDTSTGSAPTMYPNEVLTVDEGPNCPVASGTCQETIQVITVGTPPSSGTAQFLGAHAAGAPVVALGAFSTGIVPPQAAPASYTNGSTGSVLKLYGDINSDGNMLYVEYTCAPGTPTAPGFLYRNEMSITAASKPAVDSTMILLNNLLANPNDLNNNPVNCFTYQVQPLGSGYVVTDVAVTLTVQPQNPDPQTGALIPETKALLNISPRNVFEVWDTARLVDPTRAQQMPASVTSLLP